MSPSFQSSSFRRLMRPRHVVVMGGSWAEAVIVSCREMGYDGAIWPVHPNRDEIEGYPCFKSIEDLPEAPDAVFLGINRHASIDVVRQLSEMGAGGVVAFASGFAEVDDGAELQDQLIKAAGNMPVLGPNCYGMINYLDGALLWPDVHGGKRVDRGVAIITQSSNLSINLTMQTGALPIAYMMTLGNQAMVGMADLIRAAAEDERVTAIGLHIEGINNAAGFAEAVHFAKESGKPIIAMKAGASAGAQMMTFSHTASLAGAHRVSTAFLEQLGVGVIEGIDSFIQALGILHLNGAPREASILTLSCSGGEASLIADTAERHGVAMPELSDTAIAAIKPTVNPLVTVSNPFDYHTFDWGDRERLTSTFTEAMKADQCVSILIIDFPSAHLGRAEAWQAALDAWLAARDATGAIAAVLSSLPECLPDHVCAWLMENNLIPLRGFDTALAALKGACNAGKATTYHPRGLNPLGDDRTVLTEAEAKAELAAAGIPSPRRMLATSLEDALSFNQTDQAGRLVMKVSGLAHKTEEGGVMLGIAGDDAITSAWQALNPTGDRAILIEDMIDDAVAEVIVGIARDPVLGLHMVIGSGGVMTELMQDTALVMIPATRDDIDRGLASTKVDTLMAGFRGKPQGDRTALIDLVMAVQDYVLTHEDKIDEIDLNPVMVRPQGEGVVAVDALIRYAK